MSEPKTITIVVTAYDAGCLPLLITHGIAHAERMLGMDKHLGEEGRRMAEAYIGQLRGCLAAVNKARDA